MSLISEDDDEYGLEDKIAAALYLNLKEFVGEVQSTLPDDKARRLIREKIEELLKPKIFCDETNNTPTSIAAGFLNVRVEIMGYSFMVMLK